MQFSHENFSSERPDRDIPYLSVVVTGWNEHRGGNRLERLQGFVDGWIHLTKRHDLHSELLFVTWNPLEGQERLEKALDWPEDAGPCDLRVFEVPAALHDRYAGALLFDETIARNIAIRRARGEFILVTNAGVRFSNEIMQFLASRQLETGRLYRVGRHDSKPGVPASGSDLQSPRVRGLGPALARLLASLRTFAKSLTALWNGPRGLQAAPQADAPLSDSRDQTAEMGEPPFQYPNTSSDFTLMSRQDWLNVRGYAELDLRPEQLDALLCCAAVLAGAKEEILQEPLRIHDVDFASRHGSKTELAQRQTRGISDHVPAFPDQEISELIAQMRSLRSPLIFNVGGWGLAGIALAETNPLAPDAPVVWILGEGRVAPLRGADEAPYISVVIAARNDDHGGNMLGRMRAFFEAWLSQSKRYGLASEIIVVEWNPPANRPKLIDAIEWPSGSYPCRVRFVEVSPEMHQQFPHPNAVPLHQMIAKNVGIRRARGEFVLATNLDIVFSPELMRFFAERRLEPRRLYRMDRSDVSSEIPARAPADELIAFCRSHMLRVFAREGCFEFGPGGLRELEKDDIVAPDAGIRFGPGWYGVEVHKVERFRWIANDAEILLQEPVAGRRLLIDVDPGPSAGREGVGIEIVSLAGRMLGSATVKGRCHLLLDLPDTAAAGFRLRVLGGGLPLTRELRMLNLRVFGLRWEHATGSAASAIPTPGGLLQIVPVGPAINWDSSAQPVSPWASGARDAVYLHTNACGDFTLLSRDDWFDLRGYPEFPIWPMHIDSLLCYAAHHAGAREVVLREPMQMFHIEHLSGAGWTPEGETERRLRIAAKAVPVLEYGDFVNLIRHMRRLNTPFIATREDWGLGNTVLAERSIGGAP